MPSSMIFASLVVLWLLILVPAVARRQQEVARPSVAALSGRVLERPRRRQIPGQGRPTSREREGDGMDETGRDGRVDDYRDEYHGDYYADDREDLPARTVGEPDDRRWERPPPRYRPGRGGFDPEAAALAARARYAFRQRVVLAMLITAFGTGVIAAVAVPGMWWVHATVDLALVGYLCYLRRQVRLEEAIRERRAARMAGTRRPAAADDPKLDAWARRGRELTRRDDHERSPAAEDGVTDDYDGYDEYRHDDRDDADEIPDREPERVAGTGEPPRDRDDQAEPIAAEPALPRLRPAPPPALPAGTSLLEVDEEDLELDELDRPAGPGYRRAAGE